MCVSCLRRSGIARNTPLRSIVCGPCWFAGGGDISPSELSAPADSDLDSVAAALAVETLLPRTALEWYRGLLSSTWYQQIRRDAAGRLCGLLTELGLRADWDTHTSWPTWERLQEASGWRRSSTASWLAELQRQGWLLRVEGGSTPRYRPMALQHLSGNRAAVYQLRVPAQDAAERAIPTLPNPDADACSETAQSETWTPTHTPKYLSKTYTGVPIRASTRIHNSQLSAPSRRENGPDGPGQEEKQGSHFDRRVPVTHAEMLAAAAELRTDPALRRLTPRWIRAIVRTWWQAGWTNNDLRFALEHHPSTTGPARPVDRCPAAQLRRPDGWLRHRLSAWRDAHGPLVSPTADHRQRHATASALGHAAAQRLPYGATDLSPTAVAATDNDRDSAHSQLVRRWALEFHARRNAPRPDDEVATPHSRERHYRRISEQLDEGRTSTTRPAAPALPEPATSTTPDHSAEPGPATAHDRALARARAEREPGPRSLPRRLRPRRFR
ncbi:hypothetical protein [Pseudonocardia parietis]|uniref:Helix-turn-helix protein n=1 Tax=Pseudonocardia parietis TaxID=570936 RepID=A0ABS4W537_9PSEU|nr:hypothetical protein [Pseudonocardia parietis]MBP2371342.1 hypothetical protein [Pseudonocardia parietis]